MLGSAKSDDPRLIIREVIMITIPQRHGQTVDRRTNDFYTKTVYLVTAGFRYRRLAVSTRC